jgi:hypothetical protein
VVITERFVPLAGVVMAGRERLDHPRVVLPAATDLASEEELGRLADRIIAELFNT